MKQYVVDAFTNSVFSGNPAAICVVNDWPDDRLMLDIARENNLSETAFVVKDGSRYGLRWFTPGGEIDLCGHATLGTAYVINKFFNPENELLEFNTKSGVLTVVKKDELYEMRFPAYELREIEGSDSIVKALGITPVASFLGRDMLCILRDENEVREFIPNISAIKELDGLLLHISAQGKEYDCVSRSFAPKLGIAEDPVCGSGHCHIFPYWSKILEKEKLVAYQASARGGVVYGQVTKDCIVLSGQATLYSESTIYV